MGYIPTKRIPAVVEYDLSTVSVTRGSALKISASGYLSSAAISSATPLVAVAAETKNGAATGRSALASSNTDGDHKILAWPITTEVGWKVKTGTTPVVGMIDGKWKGGVSVVDATTSTDANFFIDEILDATNKVVIGRLSGRLDRIDLE